MNLMPSLQIRSKRHLYPFLKDRGGKKKRLSRKKFLENLKQLHINQPFIEALDKCQNGVFDGAFGGVRAEEVVIGEGVVVTSSSLEMLTNSCLGGIMVNLIFLEGFEEEAFVEFMVDFG
ncbi:hypothetical protein Tco_0528069 [Tanacetum coccineum]